MVDLAPTPDNEIYGHLSDNGPGVVITERKDLRIIHMAGDINDPTFATSARNVLGLPLPQMAGETREGRGVRIIWLAPDRWLVIGKNSSELVELIGKAAINDISQGRVILRISGHNARDLLNKGCPIDLDPQIFPSGQAVSTLLGHLNVVIDCVEANIFEIYVSRSYHHFICEWLVRAGKEFGIQFER